MVEMSVASRSYAERFEAARDALPGAALPWLAALRRDGIDAFTATGLPTPRLEDWKYTNVKALETIGFAPAVDGGDGVAPDMVPPALGAERPAHRLVFVDGRCRADLSTPGDLPAGATLESLATALETRPETIETELGHVGALDGRPLLALNTAFLGDGFVLRLADGVALDRPVEIVFVASSGAAPVVFHPRNLIVAGAGSRTVVIERHLGPDGRPSFANCATEIVLGDGAQLRHYKIQEEGAESFHLAATEARLAPGSAYDNFSLSIGGRLARNEIRVRLEGEGARCELLGAYLAGGGQHTDTTTVIDHAAPRTTSREVYKGVLDGRARAVFQGRITVHEGAQQTDGHQLNRTLLLSDRAEIDTKPELEIFADDVKCSHGATAGEIDDDALFYLRQRGIPETEARGILIAAFLDEVLEEIPDADVRDVIKGIVGVRLDRVREYREPR